MHIPEEFKKNEHHYQSKKLETRTEVAKREANLESKGIIETGDQHFLKSQWHTSFTPTGAITDVRQNGVGVTTLVCEIQEQNKLWLFWPPTAHNLAAFHAASKNKEGITLECVRNMEQMSAQLAVRKKPEAWVIGAGFFYATMAFDTSYHFTGWLCDRDNWNIAKKLFQDLIQTRKQSRFSHIPFRARFRDVQMDAYNWALAIIKETNEERKVQMVKELMDIIDIIGLPEFTTKNPLDEGDESRKRKVDRESPVLSKSAKRTKV